MIRFKGGFGRERMKFGQATQIVISGDGYLIHKPDKSTEIRKVLSTRKDGMIEIKAYSDVGKNYLIVNKS